MKLRASFWRNFLMSHTRVARVEAQEAATTTKTTRRVQSSLLPPATMVASPPTSPRLSKTAHGSGFQFMCATMPFLVLFLYFLYLAAVRPNLRIYQVYNDDEMEEAIRETGAIIPLTDMMVCMLVFLGLFTMLAVYIGIFVGKRRDLMKSYLSGDSCLGDVFYEGSNHKFGTFSKYAYAMYAHPVHPKEWLVRKRVRCYQHCTRERVTILLLPYHPFSGQPKADIEMDLAASEESRRDTHKVMYCLYAWIVFLLAAPAFVLFQMTRIEDEYDDPKRGLIIYLVAVLAVIPLVAFGGNYLRWRLHRHWVVNRGVVIELQKQAGSSENNVRVAQNDCGTLPCTGYNFMEDAVSPIPSPTYTDATQSTAYNSVYMA